MIYIDLPADLNLEDDEDRNVARLADAVSPDTVIPGTVLWLGPHARGRGLSSTVWTAGSSTSARSVPRTLRGADLWSSRFRSQPNYPGRGNSRWKRRGVIRSEP
jgi:hypothetical protein